MRFDEILSFRSDLYFEGAVQADWFYNPSQSKKVSESFVFHGPQNHAVTTEEVGYRNLIDTASFAQKIVEKLDDSGEHDNPFTLAIAGYGTGKSHLAVTLSEFLSGPSFHPDVYHSILANIKKADPGIGREIQNSFTSKNLVLTLNGVNDFDLHYELLRTAQKALKLYGESEEIIQQLDRAHETARIFLGNSFANMQTAYEAYAHKRGVVLQGADLQKYLDDTISDDDTYEIVNEVYHSINGHYIRWDEGVSAKQILQILLNECCGNYGSFDKIIILFDEFGRFLEYASANPGRAGDSALQQIFEAVQNAEGDIQFIGFIQADIKAYLQRVDKSSNISRYIDRFDASDKVYLSSNLETIFANLIEVKNSAMFQSCIANYFSTHQTEIQDIYQCLQRWLPMKGVWKLLPTFEKNIILELYPLHPISTYLLTSLTDWLQNRSSLTLLNEKFHSMSAQEIESGKTIPWIRPIDLISGNFFVELLNAEEQGRQRSQICILYNAILTRYNSKLSKNERNVLLANVILRICHFATESRDDALKAIAFCIALSRTEIVEAISTLENEYAVLEYDARANCFDFIADAVGANEFRRFVQQKIRKIPFSPAILERNEAVRSFAKIDEPFVTPFGEMHGIQTSEWAFQQQLLSAEQLNSTAFELYVDRWRKSTAPEQPKGLLIWVYFNKDTESKKIEAIPQLVKKYCSNRPIVVLALNDADGALQNAVVSYLAYIQMDDASRQRYVRFYEDGLKKASDILENQFDLLKRERQVFTPVGLERTSLRMAKYLSDIFETTYPLVVPFDFENFGKKSVTKGRKLFSSIARMIAANESEQFFKVQSGELKSRFDSLLRYGEYAWKTVSQDYTLVYPQNQSVARVYQILENQLHEQRYLDFGETLEVLYKPPYGLNQYSAVLLLLILAINEGYHTKLSVSAQKYTVSSWSIQVFGETKVELKTFALTKLSVIDIAETTQKYVSLFKRVEDVSDLEILLSLKCELDDLQQSEELPKELEMQYKLASIKLTAATMAESAYDKKLGELQTIYNTALENKNLGSFITAYQNASLMTSVISMNGFTFAFSNLQIQPFKEIQTKSKNYLDTNLSEWLPTQRCQAVAEMDRYEHRMKKLIRSLEEMGYVSEARTARGILEKELESSAKIQRRTKLVSETTTFLEHTDNIRTTSSLQTLDEFQSLGKKLIAEYAQYPAEEFTLQQKKLFKTLAGKVSDISNIMASRKKEMDEIWNDLYDLESLSDLKTIGNRIGALLNAGVPANDRDDFESLRNFIDGFCTDADLFYRMDDDRHLLQETYDQYCKKYETSDADVDVKPLLDKIYSARVNQLNNLDKQWKKKYLEQNFPRLTVEQLKNWKEEVVRMPGYLTSETIAQIESTAATVNALLIRKKVDYIVSLINDLNAEERKELLKSLSQN